MASTKVCISWEARQEWAKPPLPGRSRPMSPARHRCCRSEEHTSELQSQSNLVCRLLLEKKKKPQVNPDLHGSYICADLVRQGVDELAFAPPPAFINDDRISSKISDPPHDWCAHLSSHT